MEKNQIYIDLNENLQNISNIENEIAMVELAIYQKRIEEVKNNKINEIKELFEQKSKFYNQKSEKYTNKVESNIKEYINQIEKLVEVYDNLYINTFKIMENAMNNQKQDIGNIVELTEKLKNEQLSEEEINKIKNTIIAAAQKKLNYGVIIDECRARIKWCTENVQKDINEVFTNNIYKLQIYKENVITKLRRMISNTIAGKSRYKKFLEDYEKQYLEEIKSKNDSKVLDVLCILKGVTKQMDIMKKQILMQYKEMIYN